MSGDHHPDDANLSPATTPAGWFDDPYRKHDLRYWDGSAWSEHVHDREAAAEQLQSAANAPISTAGQNGRKWGVLIAVILLVGAVILVAKSLSGNDSTSVIDGNPNSSVTGAGIDAQSAAGNGTDLQNGDSASDDSAVQSGDSSPFTAGHNAPVVVGTASVDTANSDYGGISDQITVAGGFVWVVGPDSVNILDESTGKSVGSLPSDSTDAAGLFAADGRVWLLSPFTDTLTVINADSKTVEGQVDLSVGGHRPSSGLLLTDGYAWVPDGNVAVSNNPGFDIIEVIDTTTLSIVKQLEVNEGASHLMYAEGRVWMVNSLSNEVTVIDVDTLSVVATIRSGDFPSDITYADGLVWVANAQGATVSVIDPASMEIVDEIAVGAAMSPDDQQFPGPRNIHGVGGSVWITMSQDQSLKVIDTTTHEVIDSIPAGGNFAFSDSVVWVAAGSEIEAIDLDSHQSLGFVSGGSEMVYDMASTPDGLWAINEDGTLSRLAVEAN